MVIALIVFFILLHYLEYVDDFLDREAPMNEIYTIYYPSYIPEIVRLISPLAVFLSCVYVTGKRGTARDKQHFVRIARGSLYETKHWLCRAYRRNLLTKEHVQQLKPLLSALAPMLNAYLRSIRKTTADKPTKNQEQSTKH